MVRVDWTKRAVSDLDAIRAYVEQFNVAAAHRLSGRLFKLGESLSQFPERGTPAENGSRRLSTVWPYLLVYRFEADTVTIMTIRHGARSSEEA